MVYIPTEQEEKNYDLNPFAAFMPAEHPQVQSTAKREKTGKKGIPRRRKPVVQRQGHRVPGLQAEPREQGRQKLDNQ